MTNDSSSLRPQWATGPVASARYDVPERTLKEWAKKDLVVSLTIGRRRFYSIESLDALFAKARAEQPRYTPRRVPWNDVEAPEPEIPPRRVRRPVVAEENDDGGEAGVAIAAPHRPVKRRRPPIKRRRAAQEHASTER